MWSCIILMSLHIIYFIVTICLFGIPKSLSQTYYLYEARHKYLGLIFPLFMLIAVVILLPSFLMLNSYEFLIFIALGSLIFTIITPAFKTNRIIDNTHTISAWISAICSVIWILIAIPNGLNLLIGSIGVWILIMLMFCEEPEDISCTYTFWLENMVFTSLYIVLI